MTLAFIAVAVFNAVLLFCVLGRLGACGVQIMEGNQDILDAIAAADTKLDSQAAALDGIQADITALKAAIPATGGMGAEAAQQVRDALAAMTAKLDANAARAEDLDSQT